MPCDGRQKAEHLFCDVAEFASELPPLRGRFDQLQAQMEARRDGALAEMRRADEEDARRLEARGDDDWDVPDLPRRPGQGSNKKKSKGKGKSKGRRRQGQGQAARQAGTAGGDRAQEEGEQGGDEGGDEGEEESTLNDPPAGACVDDRGKEKGEEQEEAEDCAICLAAMDEGEGLSGTSCGHIFHEGCLADWSNFCAGKEREATCPFCRCSVL
jgi:hypothetical protein